MSGHRIKAEFRTNDRGEIYRVDIEFSNHQLAETFLYGLRKKVDPLPGTSLDAARPWKCHLANLQTRIKGRVATIGSFGFGDECKQELPPIVFDYLETNKVEL